MPIPNGVATANIAMYNTYSTRRIFVTKYSTPKQKAMTNLCAATAPIKYQTSVASLAKPTAKPSKIAWNESANVNIIPDEDSINDLINVVFFFCSDDTLQASVSFSVMAQACSSADSNGSAKRHYEHHQPPIRRIPSNNLLPRLPPQNTTAYHPPPPDNLEA
ncbi:hypothetical protein B566_EDAN009832 [Ephemera danica]|nr:hypothetical protein B566_EDAN009832 [Ephemera danica]